MKLRGMLPVILITFAATIFAVLVVLNFSSGEKKIDRDDEASLNIYDAGFAREQEEIFRRDIERSRRVTLDEWQQRPWTEKAWEHAMGLFSRQL